MRPATNVSHGGHSGDILYGLAVARQLAVSRDCLINVYVSSNRPAQLAQGMVHPNGQFFMSAEAFKFLEPLLSVQPWINGVFFVPEEQIPADAFRLDPWRFAQGINLSAGNIADWAGKLYGLSVDLSE